MSILVDTNVLVRLSQEQHPEQLICRQALTRLLQRREPGALCTQVAIEYWTVATRPKNVNGLGFDPARAETELRDFERMLYWLPEPPDIGSRWRRIVNKYAVRGKSSHDARLVAFMEARGITNILTLNAADFARYDGITCLLPADVK